jgi:hypothetical protein
MNAFLAMAASSLSEGEVAILFWATIGGIAVFIGLLLEKFAEWMDDRFLGGTHKPHKTLESIGWSILMLGIFAEIAVAGWSANDAWQTRQMAIKNDPNNFPIASVSAQVLLVEKGTNRVPRDPLGFGQTSLTIGSSEQIGFWRPNMAPNLTCSKCDSIKRNDPDGENMDWILSFNQNIVFPTFNGSVKDAAKWDAIKLQASFLPDDAVILGGTVRLTINSTFRDYIIPAQTIKHSADLEEFSKNPPKSVTVFTW